MTGERDLWKEKNKDEKTHMKYTTCLGIEQKENDYEGETVTSEMHARVTELLLRCKSKIERREKNDVLQYMYRCNGFPNAVEDFVIGKGSKGNLHCVESQGREVGTGGKSKEKQLQN